MNECRGHNLGTSIAGTALKKYTVPAGPVSSVAIGEYYASARDIPAGNILRLNSPQLSNFSEVMNNLGTPIKDYCIAQGIEDQIDYVVLTKGIPYTFSGMRDSVASLLYSEATHAWSGGV